MDYPHYIPARFLTLALVGMFFSGAAQASAITNLTQAPQVIEIKTAQGYVKHTIGRGETFRLINAATIKFYEKEFYLPENMEYAMWPDGAFGPQRITHKNNGPR